MFKLFQNPFITPPNQVQNYLALYIKHLLLLRLDVRLENKLANSYVLQEEYTSLVYPCISIFFCK